MQLLVQFAQQDTTVLEEQIKQHVVLEHIEMYLEEQIQDIVQHVELDLITQEQEILVVHSAQQIITVLEEQTKLHVEVVKHLQQDHHQVQHVLHQVVQVHHQVVEIPASLKEHQY